MNSRFAVFRNIAVQLAAHAGKASPRNRVEWDRAMRNEMHYISGDRTALRWALGCVFTSYAERIITMLDSSTRISRWVLSLEMLCCFTPVTLLCLAVLANLGRLDGMTGMLALTVAATGPIGLLIALKVVVLNRPSLSKFVVGALCILAAWTGLAYSLHTLIYGQPVREWRELVLIALLPALGITHLIYLTAHRASNLATT